MRFKPYISGFKKKLKHSIINNNNNNNKKERKRRREKREIAHNNEITRHKPTRKNRGSQNEPSKTRINSKNEITRRCTINAVKWKVQNKNHKGSNKKKIQTRNTNP